MKTQPKQMLGSRRAAKNICYTITIGKDIEGEHPFDHDIDWLWHQIDKSRGLERAGYYLIEGDETYVTRAWHGYRNHYKALFTCIWEIENEA